MTKRARRTAWLATMWWAAFGFGCSDGGSSSQVLTGRIDATGAVAVRAVAGGDVVTAAKVGSDGAFRIALPSGTRYRLEVLTSSGVKQVLAHDGGWKQLELYVCTPTDPFDLGDIGDSGTMNDCDPMTDPDCKPCGDDPGDPGDPPPWPCMDPADPNCGCKPDGTCPPPPCNDPMDPNCQPPCMDPTDPGCEPSCGGPNAPPCPEPEPCMDPQPDGSCGSDCQDPMDPNTCKDPCVIDPMSCGCTSNEPNCWPPPEPPKCDADEMCDPGDTMTPENVPGDFGCMEVFDK